MTEAPSSPMPPLSNPRWSQRVPFRPYVHRYYDAVVTREAAVFNAHCPELDLSAHGLTVARALEALTQAARERLQTAIDAGAWIV